MEEFEIKQGRLLGPETLLPMPEMSYEQELLNTPVPFENRVEMLSDYLKPTSKPMTLSMIAASLEISVSAARAMIKEIEPPYFTNEEGDEVYEEFTLEIIEEEIAWQKEFDKLPAYLTAFMLGEYLSKDEQWVQNHAYGLGIYPEKMLSEKNRDTYVYPKSTLAMLRILIQHTPPANDMYSITDLEEYTGKTMDWLYARIEAHDLPSAMRMTKIKHNVTRHYSQRVADVLKQLANELPPPAGDWLTISKMAALLGRDLKWVEARIRPYKNEARYLLDDTNNVLLHYPPEVFNILKNENDNFKDYPLATPDMYSITSLAEKVGRSRRFVRNRHELIEKYSDVRRNSIGKLAIYYFEEAVEILESADSRQSKI